MRIKEIEIIDMGPHKHIHVDGITELFGIIGKNGSGKSEILACLKAAMTMQWPGNDPGASFVRNSFLEAPELDAGTEPLPEDPALRKKEENRRKAALREQRKELEKTYPSNGSVRVAFEINDVHVESYRREGKSPKVWLESSELEGKLTSVADITEYLTKLYQSDLRAISEAAFPAQGTLDKAFGGTGAERLNTFMQILNLHYLEKRVKHLDGKIQQLQKDVVDLSGAQDALNEERKIARTSVEELAQQVTQFPPKAEALDCVSSIIYAMNRLGEKVESKANPGTLYTLREAPEKLSAELATAQQHMDAAVKAIQDSFNHTDMAKVLQDLQDKTDTAYRNLEQLVQASKSFADMQVLKKNLEHKREDREKLQTACTQLQANIAELRKYLSGILKWDLTNVSAQELYTQVSAAYNDTQQHQAATKFLEENREKYDKAKDRPEARREQEMQEEISEIDKAGATKKAELEQVVRFEATVRPAVEHSKCPADKDGKCLKCGLRLSEDNIATQADLDALLKSKSDLEATLEQLRKDRATLTEQLPLQRKAREEEDSLLREYAAKSEIATQYSKTAVAGLVENWDNVHAKIRELQQSEPALSSNTMAIERYDKEIEEAARTLENSTVKEVSEQDIKSADETYQSCKKAQQAWAEWERNTYTPCVKQVEKLQDFAKDVAQQRATAQSNLETIKAKLSNSTGSLSAHESMLIQSENFSELKAVLENYENDRKALQTRLTQAEEHSRGLESRWNSMQHKISESEKRKTLIDELRDARSMLKRDGAPARYAQEKFSVMIPLINEKLNVIGASFVIREKIGQPCDFEFMEKADTNNMWMPQSKLSGGQSVRATVAFLLTIQQVLTPSFGFLQLDEPSNHQDQEGIEGLREFLLDLPSLIGGHIQCILVDHNEELKSVVSSQLSITKSGDINAAPISN